MQASGGAGREILVLEDSPPIRVLIRAILEGAGYLITEAGTVAEAEAALQQDRSPELVITDIHISGENGWVAGERFAAMKPGLKVLYISGADVGAALPPGTPFISKPFAPDDLIRRVRDLIG